MAPLLGSPFALVGLGARLLILLAPPFPMLLAPFPSAMFDRPDMIDGVKGVFASEQVRRWCVGVLGRPRLKVLTEFELGGIVDRGKGLHELADARKPMVKFSE
jgi:hypothetical protein